MRLIRVLLFLVASLIALAGCGGGGSGRNGSSARGKATLRVVWPPSPRTIPGNANQIRVTLTGSGGATVPTLSPINKPATLPNGGISVQSFDLAPGTYTIQASAVNTADNTPLARGTAIITILAGKDTPFVVTMDSTVSRYKVTDLGAGGNASQKALNPAEFYIDASGSVTASGAAQPVSYGSGRTTTDILVTPQSGTGANASDLLLLPVGATGTPDAPHVDLQVLGGGLSLAGAGSGGKVSLLPTADNPTGYKATLNYAASSDTVATFRLDYYDFEYSDSANSGVGGFIVSLLRSFSSTIKIGTSAPDGFSVAVTGLPSDFSVPGHGANYRLRATLYENPVGGDPGSSYSKTEAPGVSTISFGQVVDRARGFTIDVTLQLKTEGSGWVDYAFRNNYDISIDSAATVPLPDEDSTGNIVPDPADTSPPHDLRMNGFSPIEIASQSASLKRGNGTAAGTFVIVTGVKVRIQTGTSGSNPLYASAVLDADLFSHANPIGPSRIINGQTGDSAVTQPTSEYWRIGSVASSASTSQTITAFFDVAFLGKRPGVTAPSGPFGITISPNGGNIGVGVN